MGISNIWPREESWKLSVRQVSAVTTRCKTQMKLQRTLSRSHDPMYGRVQQYYHNPHLFHRGHARLLRSQGHLFWILRKWFLVVQF
ncbi:unnamed protein product [Fasciola hepatica]|uniref:Uncharacterized protein n=1 Tax=Fasciola hepatica TaxID=6192 RepID=A0ABC9HJ94_FASHE